MQMHKILSGVSIICGLTGAAGLAGAIEFGTGYCTCTAIIVIGAVSGICARAESGNYIACK